MRFAFCTRIRFCRHRKYFPAQKRTVGSDGCSARRLDAVKKAAEHFLVLIIVHAGPFLAVSPLAAVHRSVGIKKSALTVPLAVDPFALPVVLINSIGQYICDVFDHAQSSLVIFFALRIAELVGDDVSVSCSRPSRLRRWLRPPPAFQTRSNKYYRCHGFDWVGGLPVL